MSQPEKDTLKAQIATVPTTPTKTKKRRLWLFIVPLLLLPALIIGGIAAYLDLYIPYQAQLRATAQAQLVLTHTAQARAASTAQVTATAQSIVNATATAITALQHDYTAITSHLPTFNDQLHTPDLWNWETESGCSFSNQGYDVSVAHKGFFVSCTALNTHFSNFAYQVHLKILRGDEGGIIFRADTKNTHFYLFQIGQDQTYDIYYYPNKTGSAAKHLSNGISNLIVSGLNQENIITLIARGSTLNFYINGSYMTTIIDSQRKTGQIGVIANNIQSTTEVLYTQAQLWKL